MISAEQLLQVKARLMVAGQVARHMIESPSQPYIRFDKDEYWRVHVAFAHLQTDVAAVLTELDTLRAMFLDRVNEFLSTGGLNNAIAGSDGHRQDAGEVVAGVPDGTPVGGSEEAPADEAAVGSPVPAKRPRRRRAKRPDTQADQRGVSPDSVAVDGGPSQGEMGGSASN